MKASIEKIERNKDGNYVLTVMSTDPDVGELHLGSIDLSQKKYEQKKIGDDN